MLLLYVEGKEQRNFFMLEMVSVNVTHFTVLHQNTANNFIKSTPDTYVQWLLL